MSNAGKAGKRSSVSLLSIGAGVVLVLVIVSFIGLPLLEDAKVGKSVVFGSYKGKTIAYNEAPNLFSNQVNNLAGNLGSGAPLSQVRDAWLAAFNSTAQAYITHDLLRRAGYYYDQEQVDQRLLEQVFTDENNNPDRASLRQASDQQLQYLEQAVGMQLYQEKWQSLQGLALPEKNERLRELLISPSLPLRKITVAYYQLSDYPLSEVEKYFLGHQQDFDQIELSRITTSKEDAAGLKEKIAAEGSDFAQLARDHSSDFYRELGGKVGKRSPAELKDAFSDEKLVASLLEGAMAAIIQHKQDDGAVVFFRIDQPRTPSLWAEEEVQQRVRSHMESRELSLITDYLRAQADLLRLGVNSGAGSLAQQAKAAEAKTFDTDYFPLSFGGRYPLYKSIDQAMNNATIATAARSSELFFRTAFALAPDKTSEPMLLDGRLVVVMQLLDQRQATPEDSPFGTSLPPDVIDRYIVSLVRSLTATLEQGHLLKNLGLRNNFDAAFSRVFGRRT